MILVVGDKKWRNKEKIADWLAKQDRSHTIVHESLPGASRLAGAIARELGFKVQARTTARLFDRKADLVVGFWNGKDKRTRLVLDAALSKDFEREVEVVYPHTRV